MPAGKSKAKKKSAARPRKPVLVDALAEASWSEADRALGEALTETQLLRAAANDDAREDALAMLEQALNRAARKRGLARFGQVGAREPFNPKRHHLARPLSRAPKTVRIVAAGVMRGVEVLVKARVLAVRSRA